MSMLLIVRQMTTASMVQDVGEFELRLEETEGRQTDNSIMPIADRPNTPCRSATC